MFNKRRDISPLRVAGPPFNTATSLVAGTPANTVFWYTGENGSTPALSTATAQISSSLSVSYGMRANQQGISWLLQNVAVLAATTYQQNDPNASASYAELGQRVFGALSVPTGVQSVSDRRRLPCRCPGAPASLAASSPVFGRRP